MKSIFWSVPLILSFSSYADINAMTSTGEKVLLKDNGTWIYSNKIKSSRLIGMWKLETEIINGKEVDKSSRGKYLEVKKNGDSYLFIEYRKSWGDEYTSAEFPAKIESDILTVIGIPKGLSIIAFPKNNGQKVKLIIQDGNKSKESILKTVDYQKTLEFLKKQLK